MTKQLTTEQVDRLAEIKDEVIELLNEANRIVSGTSEEQRAHSYWYAHARMAMDDEHSYLGSGGCTLQDSIEGLSVETSREGDDLPDHGDWASVARANR